MLQYPRYYLTSIISYVFELPILHLFKEIQASKMFYKEAIFKQANGGKGIDCYKCTKLLLKSQTRYSSLKSIKADYMIK